MSIWNVLMVMSRSTITSWHFSEKSPRVRLKIKEADWQESSNTQSEMPIKHCIQLLSTIGFTQGKYLLEKMYWNDDCISVSWEALPHICAVSRMYFKLSPHYSRQHCKILVQTIKLIVQIVAILLQDTNQLDTQTWNSVPPLT